MHAKKAAAAATAAATVTLAVGAKNAAETAKGHAETAAKTADEKSKAAVAAAKGELMIVGTVKSVGGSSVDAAAGTTAVTTGTGANAKTVTTGLIREPMTTGATTDGRAAVPASAPLASTPVAYVSPRVNAAARGTVKIGKELDTSDDMARLLIVTHYVGTKTVQVYDELEGTSDTNLHTRTDSDGTTYRVASDATTNAADYSADAVVLKTEGAYYRARAIPADDGAISDTEGLQAMGLSDGTPPVQQGDMVGADTKPVTVYSYTATGGSKVYVVEDTRTVTDGLTTVSYQTVQIHVPVNRDGNTATGLTTAEAEALGVGYDLGDELVAVTARIPEQAAYEHVHFGAWASLGAAKANGDQSPSELGIGFVQSIGDGLTGADMPNNGTATYSGNWAATIQEADTDGDGAFSLATGAAGVMANFTKDEITATLSGLATLEGAIAGNTFSGTKATATGGGLDTDGSFTGSFGGGFYGAKADETAGVFSFTSAGDTAGGFAGAFGGQRQAD